jgi:hypothetical protein
VAIPLRPTFSEEIPSTPRRDPQVPGKSGQCSGRQTASGAKIYAGRTAHQVDEFRGGEKRLPGWGVQVWVPADELDALRPNGTVGALTCPAE